MFFDKKTLYFLWYLLQFDLGQLIHAKENEILAEILEESYIILRSKIASQIDTTKPKQEWIRKARLRQSGNHIKKTRPIASQSPSV